MQLPTQLGELRGDGGIDHARAADLLDQFVFLVATRHFDVRRRQRARTLRGPAVARRRQQDVDARIQVTEHAGEFLLVGTEHQRLQVVGHLRVAEGFDEGAGKAAGTDRIRTRLHLQVVGQLVQPRTHRFQRGREPRFDGIGELLPSKVVSELVFRHQRQRQVPAVADAQGAEVIEALRDLLAIAHHEARGLLAQLHQRLQLDVAGRATACRGILEGELHRRIQAVGHGPEQFDRNALDLFEHARRIASPRSAQCDVGHARRIIGHVNHLPRFCTYTTTLCVSFPQDSVGICQFAPQPFDL